jgi:hypothetical protein
VRNARVVTRRRTAWPSASDSNVTFWRFGAKVRRVREFEWETLFPVATFDPVSSQRRGMRILYFFEP